MLNFPYSTPEEISNVGPYSDSYLQNRDWLVQISMSQDLKLYGIKLGRPGYKPVTTADDWAPEDIKELIS